MSSPAARYAFVCRNEIILLSSRRLIDWSKCLSIDQMFMKCLRNWFIMEASYSSLTFILIANWFVFRAAKLSQTCDISVVNFSGDKNRLFYSKSLIPQVIICSQFFRTQISSAFFSSLHCNITNGSLLQLLLSIEFTTLINSSSRSIGDCVLERPISVGNKRCIRCASHRRLIVSDN